jgi:hypothetical protein
MSSLIILLVFYLLALMDSDHSSYGLGPKERKSFYDNALVTTHGCSVMVFISHVDMTFSWMILPLF